MPGARQRAVCPICGKGFIERRRRKFWMRLVPGSKLYLCNWCPVRYLVVGGWSFKLLPQDK